MLRYVFDSQKYMLIPKNQAKIHGAIIIVLLCDLMNKPPSLQVISIVPKIKLGAEGLIELYGGLLATFYKHVRFLPMFLLGCIHIAQSFESA